jgi:hypothetical protein
MDEEGQAQHPLWPPMKPKRNSYEWFIPKGILKRNWVFKHLNQFPAVIVVFADLDWDDQDFNEKNAQLRGTSHILKVPIQRLKVILTFSHYTRPLCVLQRKFVRTRQ